jgi:pimeloyl-ACP methyl ester carboxylesterase
MPVVFVHGVPDTERVWRPILERIDRKDVVTLSLLGFACPLPPGFGAAKEDYLAWLTGTLERLPQPIDLVGHDWGSLLVVRAASTRPDLVRSWAGGGAPTSGEYVWHPAARLWQTPEVGEQMVAAFDAPAARRFLTDHGVPDAQAAETASHIDPLMKHCILQLYRSAKDVFKEWEPGLADIRAPGLVLWGENDPFAEAQFADRMGAQTRASRVVRLPHCGHWWQCEKPDETAAELSRHWRQHGLSPGTATGTCTID